jgi:hypothetical protein
MAEDISLPLAFVRAWGTYVMMHSDVIENDQRRSMLERRLRQGFEMGERALISSFLARPRSH